MENKFEDNLTRSRKTGQETIVVMYYVGKLWTLWWKCG